MIAKAQVVFCDDSAKALKVMNEKTFLRHIIVLDDRISQEALEKANQLGINLIAWSILIDIGEVNLRNPVVSSIFFNRYNMIKFLK